MISKPCLPPIQANQQRHCLILKSSSLLGCPSCHMQNWQNCTQTQVIDMVQQLALVGIPGRGHPARERLKVMYDFNQRGVYWFETLICTNAYSNHTQPLVSPSCKGGSSWAWSGLTGQLDDCSWSLPIWPVLVQEHSEDFLGTNNISKYIGSCNTHKSYVMHKTNIYL